MSFDWDVIRTTTDKLKDELNDLAWDIHQIQYIGGRDWVIICRDENSDPVWHDPDATYSGSARRISGNQWRIEIPSMGPNDEPLLAWATRAVDIQEAARRAIANEYGLDPEGIKVDIDVG